MKTSKQTISRLTIVATLALPIAALAHPKPSTDHELPLHVDDRYDSCFFDLHPELTQEEFDTFAGEAGTMTRFHQNGSAETLGKGKFDIGLAITSTPVNDDKGAWNNTMSHPDAEHDLGHEVAFPRLVARVGVSDNVDIGAWGTLDPNANYGFTGIDLKVGLLKQSAEMPVSVAIRPSVSSMYGPSEVFVVNSSVDLSVSRNWSGLEPYAGVGASANVAVEMSDDVDLDPGQSRNVLAFVGVSYQWKGIRAAAQVETGELETTSLQLGGNF